MSTVSVVSATPQEQTYMRVSGEAVSLYNDAFYKRLRTRFGISDDCIDDIAEFCFSKLRASGGKGGDMMSFTTSGKFIIKEVSGSDHLSLIKFTPEYVEHLEGDSYICRFYAHFYRPADSKSYVIMNNWLPGLVGGVHDSESEHKGYVRIYDLKGTADDKTLRRNSVKVPEVHKRVWNCGMMCGCPGAITDERREYMRGKRHAFTVPFYVSASQRKTILAKLAKDVEFLQRCGLMDYSLVVGVKECSAAELEKHNAQGGFGAGGAGDQPYVASHDGTTHALYFGIIDFLQEWTSKKMAALCVKKCACAPEPLATCPPVPYGHRFHQFFVEKFTDGRGTVREGVGVDRKTSLYFDSRQSATDSVRGGGESVEMTEVSLAVVEA